MFRNVILSTLAALALPGVATAQTYPSKIVKIVVPHAPGGGIDILARAIADGLQPKWGQPVIVENKPGASATIGAVQVAKAARDGHTLLLTSESTVVANPFLFENLAYDVKRELTPISQIVSLPQMIVASTSLPASSIKELIELARQDSAKLVYASYGSGSLPHLFFEGLNKTIGSHIAQAPYKGIIPAISATASNETQLTLLGASLAAPQMRSGKLKPLAVVGDKRLPELPDVMTLNEAGLGDIDPGVSWFGLFVTGGSPAGLPEKIQKDVADIFNDPAIRDKYVTARGLTPIFSTPQQFNGVIAADMSRMERLIKLTGAKGDQ